VVQSTIQRVLTTLKSDLAPTVRPPSAVRVVVATALSISGSLLIDALLISVGTVVFPSTRGYAHFQFTDYAKLTVIGVVIGSAAWPIVTRVSSSPRRFFPRLAIVATLALYIPDLWLLERGQPADAVAVLMTLHLAIAFITYNVLVRVARVRPTQEQGRVSDSIADNQVTALAGRRPGARRRVLGGFLLFIGVILAMTAILFVWPATDSAQHVDAILSFNGPNEGARQAQAVSLAEKGYAQVLLFSRGGDGADTPCPNVPRVLVVCFVDVPNNTRGEARFAAQYAEQHHLNSLMIVPGRAQTTRAHLLLERCFPGRIVVVPSAESFLGFPRDVFHEWGGLIETLFIHRGC
jgi:uncharacterized SAM-binding protein YcdF (DUF218 family)